MTRSERIRLNYAVNGVPAQVTATHIDQLRHILRALLREHLPYRAYLEIRDGHDMWTIKMSQEQVASMLKDALRYEHVYVEKNGRIAAFERRE